MCKKLCVNVTAYKLSDKRPGFYKTCDFETYEKYQIWLHFSFLCSNDKNGLIQTIICWAPKELVNLKTILKILRKTWKTFQEI